MSISRQSAQRLVSLAVAERLIKVRLDHPIAACLELGDALRKKFDLKHVEVVPSDPVSGSKHGRYRRGGGGRDRALAEAARSDRARGRNGPHAESGRRSAAGDRMSQAPDRVADRQYRAGRIGRLLQRHLQHGRCDQGAAFPNAAAGSLFLGGRARTLHAQALVRSTLDISAQADVTFVGIGELGIDGPLCVDGFLEKDEMMELMRKRRCRRDLRLGFRHRRQASRQSINERVASVRSRRAIRLPSSESARANANSGDQGRRQGHQINGLITDEETAEFLLKSLSKNFS
jgi:hypothetical protein